MVGAEIDRVEGARGGEQALLEREMQGSAEPCWGRLGGLQCLGDLLTGTSGQGSFMAMVSRSLQGV